MTEDESDRRPANLIVDTVADSLGSNIATWRREDGGGLDALDGLVRRRLRHLCDRVVGTLAHCLQAVYLSLLVLVLCVQGLGLG